MAKFLESIAGYKTYITAALLGLANVGAALHWWTWDQVALINGILGPLGLAFLRAGVDKAGQSAPDPK